MRMLIGLTAMWLTLAGAAAQESTVVIPPQTTDEVIYQRVLHLLPPHVGCAVLVMGKHADGSDILFKGAYGYRRLRTEENAGVESIRVTTGSNFRVASLTKVFTAAAVLKLADENKLALDDPVTKWLPGLPAEYDRVTLLNLLNHTAGISGYPSAPPRQTPFHFNDLSLLRAVARQPLLPFTTDSQCVYSNTAYVLLGLVVQQASETPFHRYLHEEVLLPLGMSRSRVLVEGLNTIEERAYGHLAGALNETDQRQLDNWRRQLAQLEKTRERLEAQGANLQPLESRQRSIQKQVEEAERALSRSTPRGIKPGAWHEEDQGPYSELGGDGALYTSIDDLHHFLKALQERRAPLSPESYRYWTEPQTTPQPQSLDGRAGRRYACGWIVDGERYSHRGPTRGFRQTLQWFPKSGSAVVVLMNSEAQGPNGSASMVDPDTERLGEQIYRAVLQTNQGPSDLEVLREPIDLRGRDSEG